MLSVALPTSDGRKSSFLRTSYRITNYLAPARHSLYFGMKTNVMKFQPLKMLYYCHQVLGRLKISNFLYKFNIFQWATPGDLPTTLEKHKEIFQSWINLVKEGLSHMTYDVCTLHKLT